MYLQTNTCRKIGACVKMQAARGSTKRLSRFAFVPAMLFLGGMIEFFPAAAQVVDSTKPVAPLTSINPVDINWQGSSTPGAVNFGGSLQSAEVNQFESSSLPGAPSAIAQGQSPLASGPAITRAAVSRAGWVAPIGWKHIPAGWVGQPLTARDKMELGARDLYSPSSMLGYVVTAGYEHAANGQPNFGTNLGAFGQQLGATVLRDSSEGIFTDAVFAPLLHQDPRYYVEGPQYSFFHRVAYAITRPFLTRTDDGRDTINSSELLGYGSASALTYTYYPKINQNFHDTAATFGGALGGSALGNLVSEFSGQFLGRIHLKKTQ